MANQNLHPSETFAYAAIRIECEAAHGTSTGTGFFFQFVLDSGKVVPIIITNRHVVKDANRGTLRLHTQQGHTYTTVTADAFESRWYGHPDASVDLCMLLADPILDTATSSGHSVLYSAYTLDSLLTSSEWSNLIAIEDVIMVGYPNGIWDSVNNMPLLRRGITATHPNRNYEGRSEFVVDMACFPGSSGSPVILYNSGVFETREGFSIGGTRAKLIGILWGGPQHTAQGELVVVNIPTAAIPVALSRIPNNLGFVIKADRIRDFEKIVKSVVGN